ncbi:MAG: hypothetical protein NVSMB1_25700 [Polyangiales bacterium]
MGRVRGGSIHVVATRPVEIVGLAPSALQLRIAIADGNDTTERLYACGLTSEGTVRCPLALLTAKSVKRSALTAGVAAVFATATDNNWMVDIDLTPQGFIATKVKGEAPDGLVGDHGWSTLN